MIVLGPLKTFLRNRSVRIALLCLVAICVAVSLLSPSVEGYYDSPYMSYLDGSTGNVLLDDGEVYAVNYGGESGPSCELIGTYTRLPFALVLFDLAADHGVTIAHKVTWIGRRGFRWKDIGFGDSDMYFNGRIVSPERLKTLRAIPRGTQPKTIDYSEQMPGNAQDTTQQPDSP